MTRAPTERAFRDLLAGDPLEAARGLLGARLVREPDKSVEARRVGRIVEVEAYIGLEDRASHARMGPTPRNAPMFGQAGIAYVYLVYGMHHCLNVVVGPEGYPAAILLRGAVPLEGAGAMRAARHERTVARRRPGAADPDGTADRMTRLPDAVLAIGPANLAAAFGVDRTDNGLDLLDPASTLRLEPRPAGEPPPGFAATPRTGVGYAGPEWAAKPWRFVVEA